MDNCTIGFPNLLKFFPDLSASDGVALASGLSHFSCTQFHIKAWSIQTITVVVRMFDLMHAISIYEA